jgi:hypothetical protein
VQDLVAALAGCYFWRSGRAWVKRCAAPLAADAAAEQGVDRLGGLAPGAFQLDLGVETHTGGQGAQARQIAGPAGVRGELVGEVQRVDPRPMERGRSPWPGR